MAGTRKDKESNRVVNMNEEEFAMGVKAHMYAEINAFDNRAVKQLFLDIFKFHQSKV